MPLHHRKTSTHSLKNVLNAGDLEALVALDASDAFLMARNGPARGIAKFAMPSLNMSL